MKIIFLLLCLILFVELGASQEQERTRLPSSKAVIKPTPGAPQRTNGFPETIALSPDGRYAALLNNGFGTAESGTKQSIAIQDLKTNQVADFPEDRLGEEAHQSYFLGLAFSSDGSHLYASMGSITDATGDKPGDTGNGIAVYGFHEGKVSWDRFIRIPPQKIAAGKKVGYGVRKTTEGTAIPYPAGLAVIAGRGHKHKKDKLLVANNLSDNVVLIDAASGRVLKQFDLSTHEMVPSSFPYTVVASRDGRRAWCRSE